MGYVTFKPSKVVLLIIAVIGTIAMIVMVLMMVLWINYLKNKKRKLINMKEAKAPLLQLSSANEDYDD
jgi:hypothetical protein